MTDDNEQNTRPNPAASNPDKGAYEHGAAAIPMLGALALLALSALLCTFLSRTTLRRVRAN